MRASRRLACRASIANPIQDSRSTGSTVASVRSTRVRSIVDLPVLILVFNRPDKTALVMDAIRAAAPPRLYVAADGPRDRPGEAERCKKARGIATAVDWPCDVHTLFRDQNLGCGVAVSSAISWFFEHEPEGVILEDDCLPCSSFFPYCDELLERYRSDTRIMCVSGDNFQRDYPRDRYSYYFSRYVQTWGWASWRRAWRFFDFEMRLWPEFRDSGMLGAWSDGDAGFEEYWKGIFETTAGRGDVWDYQFLFSCWTQGGLTCIPKTNLVSNVGFGPDSTHTTDESSWISNFLVVDLEFPLRHPPLICRDIEADRRDQINVFGSTHTPRPWIERVLRSGVRRIITRFSRLRDVQ